MAVKLIANYAKKLGLPGCSSHQFSISVELTNVEDIAGTSERLYKQLQDASMSRCRITATCRRMATAWRRRPTAHRGTGTTVNSATPKRGRVPFRIAWLPLRRWG